MYRRDFLLACASVAVGCQASQHARVANGRRGDGRRVAITMDDPNTDETPLFSADERTRRILGHLAARRVQTMLFVCGMRIDSPQGEDVLSAFDADGHLLANHSYSHRNFGDPANTSEALASEIDRCEALVAHHSGFRRHFRFPYLKEGQTAQQCDALRDVLRARDYANGHVTIDASDWAYNARLVARLEADPATDSRRSARPTSRTFWTARTTTTAWRWRSPGVRSRTCCCCTTTC